MSALSLSASDEPDAAAAADSVWTPLPVSDIAAVDAADDDEAGEPMAAAGAVSAGTRCRLGESGVLLAGDTNSRGGSEGVVTWVRGFVE